MALIKTIPHDANIELIGTQNVSTTASASVTLSKGISNFKYLLFSFSEYDTTHTVSNPILGIEDSSTFTSFTGYYGVGSPAASHTAAITKVDDTHVTIQNNDATARTLYVYGI